MAARELCASTLGSTLLIVVGACDCDGSAEPEVTLSAAEPAEEAPPSFEPDVALEPVDPPAAEGAFAPSLRLDGPRVWATWIEPIGADGHRVRLSALEDGRWSDPVTMARSEKMFANWADFPAVVRGGDGSLVGHLLEKSADETYAYDVVLLRSTDGGREWTRLGPAHDDGTPTEHGFVSYVPADAGVRLFWLDGRHTQPDEEGERGAMTLRTAELVDGELGESEVVDARVCDCCRTAAAITDRGALIAYRDRSEQEIRDIAVVRSTPNGWSEPEVVHADGWEYHGCPVNGPAIATTDDGTIALAWFTGEGERAGVWVAFDEGEGFGEPVSVAPEGSLGRVGVTLHGDAATVSWVEPTEEGSVLRLRDVRRDGSTTEPVTVAELPADRGSGFPQLVRHDGALLLAWVEGEGELSRVRAAAVQR